MEVELAAGVVVDIATRQDVQHGHDRIAKALERPRARYYPIHGTVAVPTGLTGALVIPFSPSSPPAGRQWEIQWGNVFQGTTPAAAAIATLFAALLVGRSPAGPGGASPLNYTPDPSEVTVPGQTVPGTILVPDKMFVKPQWQVFLVLQGAGIPAAGTVMNANLGVLDTVAGEEQNLW